MFIFRFQLKNTINILVPFENYLYLHRDKLNTKQNYNLFY